MSGKTTLGSRISQTTKRREKLNRLNKWTRPTNRADLAGSDTLINEVIEQENCTERNVAGQVPLDMRARRRVNCFELQNVKMRTLFIVIENVGKESI